MITALLLLLSQRGYACAVTDPREIARRMEVPAVELIRLPTMGAAAMVGRVAGCRMKKHRSGRL